MQNVLRRAVVVLIIVLGQVLLNLHLVFDPGSFCESRVLQPVINGFVWVAFNTLLCLLCIESHRTNLLKNEDRSDGTVSDKSLWYHWPKLFIWLPGTGTAPLPCITTSFIASMTCTKLYGWLARCHLHSICCSIHVINRCLQLATRAASTLLTEPSRQAHVHTSASTHM